MPTIITHANSPGAASEQPLRVLLVVSDATGGIARHVEALATFLASRGHRVGIAAAHTTALDVPATVEVHRLPSLRLNGVTDLLAVRRALRPLVSAADIVHAHGLRAGAVAARATTEVPVVVTVHNAPVQLAPAQRLAHRITERTVARHSSLVIAASGDLGERARRAGARRALVLPVTAPGHDEDGRAPEPDVPDPGRPVVLALARLAPQKRLDLLVDAAAAWSDDADAPVVWVAGDGPQRAALQRRVDEARAPVRLLGHRADVGALLARADVFVLSSDWEARPLVLQEAMRAGVPVVATAVGGIPELVGEAALLIPPHDVDAAAAAIERMLDDPALREEYGKRGLAQAATWPTEADTVAQVEAVYTELAAK
jgi:glycosyltransferase involved in cell wall biosynthesis